MYKPKTKITAKYIKALFDSNRIFAVGYADLHYLFYCIRPDYYTCGVYGWNADIYILDKIIIVTGYRPFGNYTSFELVRKYEEKAKQILSACHLYPTAEHEKTKSQLDKLIAQFENEVLESVRK